jgi:dihydrofolate reductase
MRRIVVSEFISLDGVMQDPGGAEKDKFKHGGWTWPYWGEDIAKYKNDELYSSDALLLGRITYQSFAGAFAPRKDEFSEKMNSNRKFVVSKTLSVVDWNNSRLIRENIAEEIAKLREQHGQDILVGGSRSIVHLLIRHNLVDLYRLVVYPVVLGSGYRMFPDGPDMLKLKLIESKPFKSGVIALEYVPER